MNTGKQSSTVDGHRESANLIEIIANAKAFVNETVKLASNNSDESRIYSTLEKASRHLALDVRNENTTQLKPHLETRVFTALVDSRYFSDKELDVSIVETISGKFQSYTNAIREIRQNIRSLLSFLEFVIIYSKLHTTNSKWKIH